MLADYREAGARTIVAIQQREECVEGVNKSADQFELKLWLNRLETADSACISNMQSVWAISKSQNTEFLYGGLDYYLKIISEKEQMLSTFSGWIGNSGAKDNGAGGSNVLESAPTRGGEIGLGPGDHIVSPMLTITSDGDYGDGPLIVLDEAEEEPFEIHDLHGDHESIGSDTGSSSAADDFRM